MNQSSELTLATNLFQQLQLWKAVDFRCKFFLLTVANVLFILLKPGLLLSCKDRKHMFANTVLSFPRMPLSSHIVVMIAGIHISQEMFAVDMLTALKPSLEHDRKHVLRLLRLYLDGDQA